MKVKTVLGVIVALILLILVLLFFPIPSKGTPEIKQIVLEFSSEKDGLRYFVPKGKIGIGLLPLNSPAPLSPGTLSICRVQLVPVALRFLDGKEAGPVKDILFICGEDRYIFTSLGIPQEAK